MQISELLAYLSVLHTRNCNRLTHFKFLVIVVLVLVSCLLACDIACLLRNDACMLIYSLWAGWDRCGHGCLICCD